MRQALSDSGKARAARQCFGSVPDAAPMLPPRADVSAVRVERVGARLHVCSSGRALIEQEARPQSGGRIWRRGSGGSGISRPRTAVPLSAAYRVGWAPGGSSATAASSCMAPKIATRATLPSSIP